MDINTWIDRLRSFLHKVRDVWANGCIGKIVVLVGLWFACSICTFATWVVTPQSVKDSQNATATAQAVDDEATKEAREVDREAAKEARETERNAAETAESVAEQTADAQESAEATSTMQAIADATENAPTEDPNRAAIEEYWTFVGNNIGAISEASAEAGKLMGAVGENPAILFDDDWKLKMAVALGFMGGSAEAILNRENVPTSATDLHAALEEMASLVTDSTSDFANGIDNIDSDLIISGGEKLSRASSVLTSKVAPELARFQAQHGLVDVE